MAEKVKKAGTGTGEAKGGKQEVEFSFHAAGAKKVCLAGEFNSWNTQSLLLKADRNGVWKIRIKLAPGRYEYKFIADGTWVENLPGVESVMNSSGTRNFVIRIK